MSEPRPRVLATVAAFLALAVSAPAADLVVVERPISAESLKSLGPRCVSGSRLVHLGADGTTRNLTPEFDGACDPSVSFDGREMLFSGRMPNTYGWQVWKMDLQSGHTVKVTNHEGYAFSPVWVGSIFHLDDEAPTRRIAYLATLPNEKRFPVLHTANLDGSGTLRISYGDDADLSPDVLPNGRLVYSTLKGPRRLQYTLMGLNIDGTDLAVYADPHHTPPGRPHAVRVGSDGRVYFIDSESRAPGGGALVFVEQRRPLRTRTVLATTERGLFLDPAPLVDGTLLASFVAEHTEGYRLVSVDRENGRVTGLVHNSEGFDVLDAHEITPRPVVPGRSTVVDTSKGTGVFFCLSSHITDRPSLSHLRDGGVSRLRVIEHNPHRDPLTRGQILGEAPIESDGSFHIEVPAQRPLRFQLLDAEGTVIGEQESWTWVMPREWRGCIGCHENREMVAPNILADAVVKPAVPVGIAPKTDGEE